MKTNPDPDQDAVQRVLGEWQVKTPLPPRFEEQVWRRISQAESRPTVGSALRSLWLTLQSALARPQVAYATLAMLLVAGALGGSWAARRETTQFEAALSSRYVQSVDPYQKVGTNP